MVTNVVKTLVPNEDSRDTRSMLRASLAYYSLSGVTSGQITRNALLTHFRNLKLVTAEILLRLLLDLNSKDRDILEVNSIIYCSNLKFQKYMHSRNVPTLRHKVSVGSFVREPV